MVRRTKADALETRNALLDAAEQIFSRQGVTNTSMMQVAEAADVTRGAIYHHFKNKVDLIDSLMARVQLPVDEMRCQVKAETEDNPLQQIKLRAKHFIRHAQNDPHALALIEILLHKCEYVDDELPIKMRHLTGRNACIDDIAELFELAIKKQQIPESVNPRLAVIGLFSLMDGIFYNWLLDKNYFDLAAVANQSIDAYLNGLATA